jgi:hypothetical protein
MKSVLVSYMEWSTRLKCSQFRHVGINEGTKNVVPLQSFMESQRAPELLGLRHCYIAIEICCCTHKLVKKFSKSLGYHLKCSPANPRI